MSQADIQPKPLALHGVFDRGVPNKERIMLQANIDVPLNPYGLLVGVCLASGAIVPINDTFFWLGSGALKRNDWLAVFTGPGVPRETVTTTGSKLYSIFWGKGMTVFNSPDSVPVLVLFDSYQAGRPLLPPPASQAPAAR